VPVGTLGVGSWGARNAAHLALRMLAVNDPALHRRLVLHGSGAGRRKAGK
jgi:phosphoribosylcarboxyaminoimidazole (NCAIR) mutase